jgi:hypothetical protein
MAGDKIPVVSPDGVRGEIPAAQAEDAIAQGFRPLTPEVEAELERHEKFGDVGHQALAGVAGIARGLTLGASDLALTHIKPGGEPLVKPETLKALEEEHPTTSTLGEIGGALLPAAVTLGAGGAAAGAKAASVAAAEATPAGLTTALGTGVEKLATKVIANEIAAKIAGGIARGAAESELYNIGHNLSEAALGDEKVTAERLLAHTGDALAIGGGLGFGITAAGIAVKKAAEKASGALEGMQGFLRERFPLASPDTLNKYAEATAEKTGLEADTVKEMFQGIGTPEGQAMRNTIGTPEFLTPEARDQLGREFKDSLSSARDAVDAAKKDAFREMRPREIESLVHDVDPKAASEAAFKLSDDMRAKLDVMRAEPDVYAAKSLIKKLEIVADGYDKKLLAAESPAELFNLIDDTKRVIDKQLVGWGKNISPEFQDTVNVLRDVRGQFKSHLTDEALWGEAAARQAAFNDASARLFDAEKVLFGSGQKPGVFGIKVPVRGGFEMQINSKKINTFISQTGAARSETATNALQEWLAAAKGFTNEVENTSFHAELPFDRAGVDSLLQKSEDVAANAEKKMALESKVRQAARLDDIGMNMFPGTAAAAMGAVVGGIPGAAAAAGAAKAVTAAANTTANPVALARTLAKIEAFALGPAKRMAKAIDEMIGKAEPAIEGAAKRTEGEAARQIIGQQEDRLKEFKVMQKRLADATTYAEEHARQLQEGVSRLADHAPNTQQAIVAQQMKIAQFLQSKLPTNPFSANETNPAKSYWQPSGTQLATFQRYTQAATDPLSVIKNAARGIVTPEGMETIRTLYPGLFNDFKQQLFEKVATDGKTIPYSSLVALSTLFDMPLHAAMRPDVRKGLQANFVPTQEKKKDTPNIPRGESKTGKNLRTEEQARAER